MSSGDPLVDEQAQRESALNKLLNSLSDKGKLQLLSADQGDDPLVDLQEAARKKRQDLIDSLAGKGNSLLELDDDKQSAGQKDAVVAQETDEARTVEEALRAMNDFANTELSAESRRITEADLPGGYQTRDELAAGATTNANRELAAEKSTQRSLVGNSFNDRALAHPRMMLASGSTQATAPGSTDLVQMFGGAFVLLAVVALVAVIKRRRSKKETDYAAEYEYQLYM